MEINSDWIDISVTIQNNMVNWPGQPPVSISLFESIEQGDVANVTQLNMSAHTGTHMDAPRHFIANGKDISEAPLSALTGKAKVIDIKNKNVIEPEDFAHWEILPGDKILFKTKDSSRDWTMKPFMEDYVYLSNNAAKVLAEKKADLIGVDYLSIGGNENGEEVHKIILGGGIWVVEGLYLKNVPEGEYELVCLPMKIKNADGAPSRVIIRPLKKI